MTQSQTLDRTHDRLTEVGQAERRAFAALAGLDRARALRAFLVFRGLTIRALARVMEVDEALVCRLVSGHGAPAQRLDQMRELGVPDELLPEPTRGRKAVNEPIPEIEKQETQKGDAA